MDMSAVGKAQKESNSYPHVCLHPECKERTIGSHSQQRRGQLLAIADDDEKVFSYERNIYQSIKQREVNENFNQYRRTPISVASVFPGYCSTHDRDLFAPIETASLEVGNKYQSDLLFLRACSFEVLQKKRAYTWNSSYLKNTSQDRTTGKYARLKKANVGIGHFLENDGAHMMERAFECIYKDGGSDIVSAWVEIPHNIQISSSCTFSPLAHFHAAILSDYSGKCLPFVSLSVVPNSNSTHVVISWLKEHHEYSSWIHDVVTNNEELEMWLNQFSLGESEDTCISPALWNKLSEDQKTLISDAVGYSRIYEHAAPVPRLIEL